MSLENLFKISPEEVVSKKLEVALNKTIVRLLWMLLVESIEYLIKQ